MHRLDLAFLLVVSVDKDIIQIYNDKNIKFFYKNLINIALERYRSIGQSKWHYLILKVTISGPDSSFSLISFANSHLMLNTGEIE